MIWATKFLTEITNNYSETTFCCCKFLFVNNLCQIYPKLHFSSTFSELNWINGRTDGSSKICWEKCFRQRKRWLTHPALRGKGWWRFCGRRDGQDEERRGKNVGKENKSEQVEIKAGQRMIFFQELVVRTFWICRQICSRSQSWRCCSVSPKSYTNTNGSTDSRFLKILTSRLLILVSQVISYSPKSWNSNY